MQYYYPLDDLTNWNFKSLVRKQPIVVRKAVVPKMSSNTCTVHLLLLRESDNSMYLSTGTMRTNEMDYRFNCIPEN